MKYALQLDPNSPLAWTLHVTWDGYWTGLGYVEHPNRALLFSRKRDATQVMLGHPIGMNGCMKVVAVSPSVRENADVGGSNTSGDRK